MGGGRGEQIFRCRLFQRISGLSAEAAPGYRQEGEAPFRAETARAVIHQTPELVAELDRAAREFLTASGIEAEPVTWQLLPQIRRKHPHISSQWSHGWLPKQGETAE